MKLLRDIVLPICAAAAGYAFGLFSGDTPTPPTGDKSVSSPPAHGRDIAATPAQNLVGLLIRPGSLHDYALLDERLAEMDPTRFAELLAALESAPPKVRAKMIPMLVARWFERDPAAAERWLAQWIERLGVNASTAWGGELESGLLGLWARRSPAAAMEMARKHWGNDFGRRLLSTVINNTRREGFPDCLTFLRSLPESGLRTRESLHLFQQWVQYDGAASLAAAQTLPPGPERESAIAQSLAGRGQREPIPTLERAKALGQTRPRLLATLVVEASWAQPVETARWLEQQDPAWIANAGRPLVANWARKDPLAAFAWAHAHGISLTDSEPSEWPDEDPSVHWDSNLRGSWSSPLRNALKEKPEETLAWLLAQPDGPERDVLLQEGISRAESPATAISLFRQLPPGEQSHAAMMLVSRNLSRDPPAVQKWAAELPAGEMRQNVWQRIGQFGGQPVEMPPGADRDAMLDGLVIRYAAEPAKALSYVMEMGDAASRRRAFDHVMWEATQESKPDKVGAAREILKKANVPDEWKKSWQ